MVQKPTYEELLFIIQDLTAKLEKSEALLAKAEARIAKLEAQLNLNSRNSSKPPSSDGYKKPKPVNSRKKTGKKKGAQEGHKGSGLKLPHEPDNIVEYLPKQCENCDQKDI